MKTRTATVSRRRHTSRTSDWKDIPTQVTDAIIAELEKGNVPWRKPWSAWSYMNAKTGHCYRGINPWLLALGGFKDPRFLTYRQAQDIGGNVRKGEKSSMVVHFTWVVKRNPEDKDEIQGMYPSFKKFSVFNVEQCEGLDPAKLVSLADLEKRRANRRLTSIYEEYANGPALCHGGERAFYMPSADSVTMPEIDRFESSFHYEHTLAHELVHSTGHASRLNRKGITTGAKFGSPAYALEELIAEIGAAMLMTEHAIMEDLPNSAAYVQSWLKALKDDKSLVIRAASQAQKAAEHILGIASPEYDDPQD